MTPLFALITIMVVSFFVLIAVFPITRSPLWDAVCTYTLYTLGVAIVVLGLVGAVGSISGLL